MNCCLFLQLVLSNTITIITGDQDRPNNVSLVHYVLTSPLGTAQ